MERLIHATLNIYPLPFDSFIEQLQEIGDGLKKEWDSVEIWGYNLSVSLQCAKDGVPADGGVT